MGLWYSYGIKSNRESSNLLFFPVILLLLFSIFHLYPILTGEADMRPRLILFTVPIAFLLIAKAIDGVTKLFPKPLLVAVFLGGVLIYPSIDHINPRLGFTRQEMKPLVSCLYQHFSPEDSVYVFKGAVPAFQFYTRKDPIPFDQGTTMEISGLSKDLERVFTSKRIWAIVSHARLKYPETIKHELERRHGLVVSKVFPGAWLLMSSPDNRHENSIKGADGKNECVLSS